MKPAQIRDIWRAVRKSSKRVLLRVHVRWTGIPRLTDGQIDIVRPITLICGENGAGKSSLLHTLVHAATREQDLMEGALYCRPRKGQLELVEIEIDSDQGVPIQITGIDQVGGYFFPEDAPSKAVFVDAGMHVPAVLEFIKQDTNFSDLLEGVDPTRFNEQELALTRFVVGRNYDEVLVYEISDTAFASVLPYFRMTSQGVTYDTLEMGYGEIAVVYVLWSLARAPSGSLILIEEPETFLSPRAQTALVDVIAKYVKERQFIVVMTSHSGAIATRLDNSEIIYTTRAAGRVAFHNPARTSDLVSRLGLVPERRFIFFVEDQAAEIFARVLVDNYSDRLAGSVEYVVCGGDGNVLRALEVLPVNLRSVAHLAVLDGDQRSRYDGEDPRVVYLPGNIPPDRLLLEFATSLSSAELGAGFDVSENDADRAQSHADGEELHEWLHTFARTLNIPYSEVVRRLAALWARASAGSVEQFIKDVEAFCSN